MSLINQELALKLIHKQKKQNKLAHAYLFVGQQDTLEMAYYLAQSLMCPNSVDGACLECSMCQRIRNNSHVDFIVLSGKETSIKKEDILDLKKRFVQSSLETSNRKVYILEDVDNATPVAMNALLKFLEEPESDITAILTTSNENKVLETIRSRCLSITLKNSPYLNLEEILLGEGYDALDAFYLSRIAQDQEEAESIKDFDVIKDIAFQMIEFLSRKDYLMAGITLQVEGIKKKKLDRNGLALLCEIFELTFSSRGQESSEIKRMIESINRLDILEISQSIADRIRIGISVSLLMDQFVYELTKGGSR